MILRRGSVRARQRAGQNPIRTSRCVSGAAGKDTHKLAIQVVDVVIDTAVERVARLKISEGKTLIKEGGQQRQPPRVRERGRDRAHHPMGAHEYEKLTS